MPNQGEVYLAPFPFSDEPVEKKRPVLIISNSVFNAQGSDVIVMAMTSNLDDPLPGVELTRIRLSWEPCPNELASCHTRFTQSRKPDWRGVSAESGRSI